MRLQDKIIFSGAASDASIYCWILVRRTNPKSLPYVGVPGFMPKRLDCKAKTADEGRHSGLVVNPKLLSGAFSPAKLEKAVAFWDKFEQEVLSQRESPYTIDADPKSDFHGCVLIDGNKIHGDYDLYDIVDPKHAHRNLAAVETMLGQPHRRGPKLFAVQEYVNSRIGVPMVQHGGEAQYTDHSEQAIDVFGPNREQCTILNQYSVRGWYRERFGGRQTLA